MFERLHGMSFHLIRSSFWTMNGFLGLCYHRELHWIPLVPHLPPLSTIWLFDHKNQFTILTCLRHTCTTCLIFQCKQVTVCWHSIATRSKQKWPPNRPWLTSHLPTSNIEEKSISKYQLQTLPRAAVKTKPTRIATSLIQQCYANRTVIGFIGHWNLATRKSNDENWWVSNCFNFRICFDLQALHMPEESSWHKSGSNCQHQHHHSNWAGDGCRWQCRSTSWYEGCLPKISKTYSGNLWPLSSLAKEPAWVVLRLQHEQWPPHCVAACSWMIWDSRLELVSMVNGQERLVLPMQKNNTCSANCRISPHGVYTQNSTKLSAIQLVEGHSRFRPAGPGEVEKKSGKNIRIQPILKDVPSLRSWHIPIPPVSRGYLSVSLPVWQQFRNVMLFYVPIYHEARTVAVEVVALLVVLVKEVAVVVGSAIATAKRAESKQKKKLLQHKRLQTPSDSVTGWHLLRHWQDKSPLLRCKILNRWALQNLYLGELAAEVSKGLPKILQLAKLETRRPIYKFKLTSQTNLWKFDGGQGMCGCIFDACKFVESWLPMPLE